MYVTCVHEPCVQRGEQEHLSWHMYLYQYLWASGGGVRLLPTEMSNSQQLSLFLSGSSETTKPFCHCVIQRNKNLAWKSMPEWCFALLIQPVSTRQTSLAEPMCSLLRCEIRLPKVEGERGE